MRLGNACMGAPCKIEKSQCKTYIQQCKSYSQYTDTVLMMLQLVPIPTTDVAVLMLCSFSASSMFFTVFIICYEFYEVLCNNLIGKKTGNLLQRDDECLLFCFECHEKQFKITQMLHTIYTVAMFLYYLAASTVRNISTNIDLKQEGQYS